MKVSYKNLQEYFDGALPLPDALAGALTFHAWEIEGVEQVGSDTVIDVKVLPDKSAWALSHRGIAKDISAVLGIPLAHDPLGEPAVLEPKTTEVTTSIDTPTCTRYTAALIRGVKVGPSPAWLVEFLASMGQRSINNVVDVTNYVMFGIGQPIHAYDASKLSKDDQGRFHMRVRGAKSGERITSLTGEVYELSTDDALIVDGGTDAPIGIAGIKGGKVAEVDSRTIDIVLESANFNPVMVRKTSQRIKLRTDASARFENGISRSMAPYGVLQGALLIAKLCGGQVGGFVDTNSTPVERTPVVVTCTKINSVLGLSLTMSEVETIMKRFGYAYEIAGDMITVTPPQERPDLVIAEDVIEEIGRIHGYEHVASVPIPKVPLHEINKSFFYSERVRDFLCSLGFSEVFTSSFRDQDEVQLANALASDKGYLRSALYKNLNEALTKNAGNVELFGTDKVRIFEIGTVFTKGGEKLKLAFGVSSKAGVTAKDFKEVSDVYTKFLVHFAVSEVVHTVYEKEGVNEIDLSAFIKALPTPTAYDVHPTSPEVAYVPFSNYPHAVRDIAFWTEADVTEEKAKEVVEKNAGALLKRIDCFDRFEKEGKVSYGFRIIFQSYEKTLTAEEVDAMMQSIFSAVSACGWVVR